MMKPKGELRPTCRWPDHKWQLKKYSVAYTPMHTLVFKILECHACGCIKADPMPRTAQLLAVTNRRRSAWAN